MSPFFPVLNHTDPSRSKQSELIRVNSVFPRWLVNSRRFLAGLNRPRPCSVASQIVPSLSCCIKLICTSLRKDSLESFPFEKTFKPKAVPRYTSSVAEHKIEITALLLNPLAVVK